MAEGEQQEREEVSNCSSAVDLMRVELVVARAACIDALVVFLIVLQLFDAIFIQQTAVLLIHNHELVAYLPFTIGVRS